MLQEAFDYALRQGSMVIAALRREGSDPVPGLAGSGPSCGEDSFQRVAMEIAEGCRVSRRCRTTVPAGRMSPATPSARFRRDHAESTEEEDQ